MLDFKLRKYIGSIDSDSMIKVGIYINEIVELSNIVRKYGLLALEESVNEREDNLFNRFLKKLMLLVVDGTEPKTIEDIADTLILMSYKNGWELLTMLVIKSGALDIQYGTNSRLIEEKLNAWLGLDYLVGNDNCFVASDDETEDDLMEFFDSSDLPN